MMSAAMNGSSLAPRSCSNTVPDLCRTVPASHEGEHGVGSRLHRDMEMRADPRTAENPGKILAEALRLQRRKAKPGHARRSEKPLQQLRQPRPRGAPRADVDPGKNDLPPPQLFKLQGAAQHLFQLQARRGASRLRNPAVSAAAVAAVLDLQECAGMEGEVGGRDEAKGSAGRGGRACPPGPERSGAPSRRGTGASISRDFCSAVSPAARAANSTRGSSRRRDFLRLGDDHDVIAKSGQCFPLGLRGAARHQQPHTSGWRETGPRISDRALWSAREVTVQVLTTWTSAVLVAQSPTKPAARKEEASASVSYWLSLHPKVWNATRRERAP